MVLPQAFHVGIRSPGYMKGFSSCGFSSVKAVITLVYRCSWKQSVPIVYRAGSLLFLWSPLQIGAPGWPRSIISVDFIIPNLTHVGPLQQCEEQ